MNDRPSDRGQRWNASLGTRRAVLTAAVGCWLVWVSCWTGAQAAPALPLEPGDRGPSVVLVQHALHQLGSLEAPPDGIYAAQTAQAVRTFQQRAGLNPDGIVGRQTWQAIQAALQRSAAPAGSEYIVRQGDTLWSIARRYGTTVEALAKQNGLRDPSTIRAGQTLRIAAEPPGSRGGRSTSVELVTWEEADRLYTNFSKARVIDVETGESFWVRRYYGHNHADSEPLTAEDTAVMRRLYQGRWSWARRAIVLEIDGRRLAASMNGMPHGQGAIAGNGFPGHFCIHFLGSKTHGTGRVDPDHQRSILRAAGYVVDQLWLER